MMYALCQENRATEHSVDDRIRLHPVFMSYIHRRYSFSFELFWDQNITTGHQNIIFYSTNHSKRCLCCCFFSLFGVTGLKQSVLTIGHPLISKTYDGILLPQNSITTSAKFRIPNSISLKVWCDGLTKF